jgi:predicted Zn-dependent protease
MSRKGLNHLGVVAVAAAAVISGGCAAVSDVAQTAAETGVITEDQASSVQKTSGAFEKAAEDITPRQAYYIGRAVAADILKRYDVYKDDAANRYINRLGQSLAATAPYPMTYGGYHFLILDSDEINAFAAPGGFILISRGLLELCPNEDAVAGVLAHEIVHVGEKHGLKAIKQGRLSNALSVLATESARTLTNDEVADLAEDFAASVSDITNKLIKSGYSRALERDADTGAVAILEGVGYRTNGFAAMLEALAARESASDGKSGLLETHPDPTDRLADVREAAGDSSGRAPNATREQRFQQFRSRLGG